MHRYGIVCALALFVVACGGSAAVPAATDEQAMRERAAGLVRRSGSVLKSEVVSLRRLTVAELGREPELPAALLPDERYAAAMPVYLARVHAPGAVTTSCACNPDAAVAADWWLVLLDAADGTPLTWVPIITQPSAR